MFSQSSYDAGVCAVLVQSVDLDERYSVDERAYSAENIRTNSTGSLVSHESV